MNDKTQNVIIALLAICVVLVSVTVYAQSKQLVAQGEKIDRLVYMATEQQRQAVPANQQDALAAQSPSPTQKPSTANIDPGSDGEATIIHGDFAAWLPLDWESRATTSGVWEVTNDQDQYVATIGCPSAETGYEAWDITKSSRTYTHNGKTLHAGKWIGKPIRGSENLGWLATVWGGSPDKAAWGGTGCQITFKVSSPPTSDQLDRIETIYQMIR